MKKSTKGALAAGAAASILLGGAGSLAYWTDTATVAGTDISSGHLKLVNGSCAGWKLDDGTALASGDRIVPGEVLSQACTFKVDAVGKHLKASFNVTSPTWASTTDLSKELTTAATYKVGTTPAAGPTAVSDGDIITANVTVTFNGAAATNGSEDLGATLNDITVTATQSH